MQLDILTGLDDRLLAAGSPSGRPCSLRYGVRLDIDIALYHDDGEVTAYTQAELEEFKANWGNPCKFTVLNHLARLIELAYVAEKAVAHGNPAKVVFQGR